MTPYATTFLDAAGKRRSAQFWAATTAEARSLIRRRGGTPLAVRPSPQRRVRRTLRLKAEVAIAAMDQLALLLDAQVPLDGALREILRECPDRDGKALFAEVHNALCSHGRVAAAFGLFPRQFPPHLLQLIEVGHSTGRLAHSFRELAKFWTAADEGRRVVHRALVYPAIAGTLVLAVLGFLFGYVLPQFDRVYRDLGVALPQLTRGCITVSRFLREHPFVVAGVLVVCATGFWVLAKRPRSRAFGERLLARAAPTRTLVEAVATARFASLLEALTRGGIAVQDAIRHCRLACGNAWYDEAMAKASHLVHEGVPLSDALERTGRIPATAIASIRIGEQTNRLEESLGQVRVFFARVAADRVQRTLQLLEPALTIVLGLVVGAVAVSLFQPLVTLAMAIKR
ncbi:type II secretion system F family protein [Nibricoccus sp. IMCC34717]|uniref:type II secretion system F family protein n=1 Tax=Nibricoccus sp. IMCC34717 TaxID=3034021 RepID=UPI00385024A1